MKYFYFWKIEGSIYLWSYRKNEQLVVTMKRSLNNLLLPSAFNVFNILFSIVSLPLGVTMLNNIVHNNKQCRQENIFQAYWLHRKSRYNYQLSAHVVAWWYPFQSHNILGYPIHPSICFGTFAYKFFHLLLLAYPMFCVPLQLTEKIVS